MNSPIPYLITIDQMDPQILLENRSVHIFFTLANYSGQDTSGSVTAFILRGPGTTIVSTTWPVGLLAKNQSATGVVTLTLPNAGQHYRLVLTYHDSSLGTVAAIDQTSIDIAARYSFTLDTWNAHVTRSVSADEDYVSLVVVLGNQTAAISREAYLGFIRGPQDNAFPKEMMVTGLDVVPGTEPQNTVTFYLTMLNKDSTSLNSAVQTILNTLSDLGDVALSFIVNGDAGQILNQYMHQLHNVELASCDGIVVTDKIIATGQTLAEWTANSEWRSEKRTYTGSQYKSPAGCGATSVYDVAWSLKRLRAPVEEFKVTPEYKNMLPDEVFEFHADPPNIPVLWSVDGLASGVIDKDFGTYKAPNTAFPGSLIVVRATATDKSGRYAFGFVRVQPRLDKHDTLVRTGPPL